MAQSPKKSPLVGPIGFLVLLLFLGAAVRLVDLTDPPLDFHAWRQLRSASIARKYYYQSLPNADPQTRELAIQLGSFDPLEPPIFEHLTAFAYRMAGAEELWIARLLAIGIWLLAGIPLFLLGKHFSSDTASLLSVSYYLLLPFSVTVSRAFLPDVLLQSCSIFAFLFLYRWSEKQTLGYALLAGVAAGFSILIKVFAVYPMAFVYLFLILSRYGFPKAIRNLQVWLVGLLMTIIPAGYYLVLQSGSASSYLSDWVFPFSSLLIDPWFYIRWAVALYKTVTIPAVIVALIGLFFSHGRQRMFLVALWIGYFFIGISVPSLIISHSYYQTILIPIVALSLAPILNRLVTEIGSRSIGWRWTGLALFIFLIGIASTYSISHLLEKNYRNEIMGWIKMGQELPRDGRIIGLTHDYNNRLRYYGWINVDQWPHATDYAMHVLAGGNYDPSDPAIKADFLARTEGYGYFLVTLFEELEQQQALNEILHQYPHVEGDGYVLFILHQPTDPIDGINLPGIQ